jgi:hypothetical protein
MRSFSGTIEEIREATYEQAETDDTMYNTATARWFGPFADDEMARKYIVAHLRHCADVAESGELDDVPSVASVAESLLILTRELALEPCETEFEFSWCSFIDSDTDEDFLRILGVSRASNIPETNTGRHQTLSPMESC